MSGYTVQPLPPEHWRGTTVKEWGLSRGKGQWLTWPPGNKPAGFVSQASAQRHADKLNDGPGYSSRNSLQSGRPNASATTR